jgi:hypothetical protein
MSQFVQGTFLPSFIMAVAVFLSIVTYFIRKLVGFVCNIDAVVVQRSCDGSQDYQECRKISGSSQTGDKCPGENCRERS